VIGDSRPLVGGVKVASGLRSSANRGLNLFVWLVTDDWCWFLLREKYCWLVAGGWFVLREKYYCLVADKPNEQGVDGSLRGALVLLSMIFTSDMVGLLAGSSCTQRRPMWTHLTILSTGYDKSSMSRMVPWVQWLQTCEFIAVVARYIELILN
jgi:hypothetical protein